METELKAGADAARGFVLGEDGSAPGATPVRSNPDSAALGRTSAEAFDTLLRLYVCAMADNLHCTLTGPDPEGPHQLRVTLRRLRAALHVFRRALRRKLRKRLACTARNLGRIVSDLRDADVIIEETFRPVVKDTARDGELMAALEAWREEVRERVRADLAAGAAAFASELRRLGDLGGWRPKGKRKHARLSGPAAALTGPAMDAAWARAARRGGRVAVLPPVERHELRKDLKSLRYAAEIAAAVNPGSGSKPFLTALKCLQGDLGYLNDLATLERFDPPMPDAACAQAFNHLRRRLIARHARRAEAALAGAEMHWRALAKAERFWK